MEPRTVTRTLRTLRRRKRISQRVLGQRLGISQGEVSRRERSGLERCSVLELQAWATTLGAHVVLDLRVDGNRPLTDARHAAIQAWLANVLRAAGWLVEVEVSFNQFGDRGRIDLLAFHPLRRVLLVVEVKTQLADVQEVLGALDVKQRVAPVIARSKGWTPSQAVPALVAREDRTIRRRVTAHAALFDHFALRARAAMAWLRHPDATVPRGILLFANVSTST